MLLYAAGDEPNAALPGFWERRWGEAENRARGGKAVLLLDEVHRLGDWAGRLKGYRKRGQVTLASTNLIESAFSVVETVCRNVKRWRPCDQAERWVGSGFAVGGEQVSSGKGLSAESQP